MPCAGMAYDSIRWMDECSEKKHLDTAREDKVMTVAAACKRTGYISCHFQENWLFSGDEIICISFDSQQQGDGRPG